MMFGQHSTPGVNIRNPGAAQSGAAIAQMIGNMREQKKRAGVQAVLEDSMRQGGTDDDAMTKAVMHAASKGIGQSDPMVQGVMSQLGLRREAQAKQQRANLFEEAAGLVATGKRDEARMLLIENEIPAAEVNAAIKDGKGPSEWLQKINWWAGATPEQRQTATDSGAIGRVDQAPLVSLDLGDKAEPEEIQKARFWEAVLTDEDSSDWLKAAARRELAGSLGEADKTAIGAVETAQQTLDELVQSVAKEGTGWPIGELGQRQEQMHAIITLEYANLAKRGANFTDMEQQLINSVIGDDPTALGSKLVRHFSGGDPAYLDRLRTVQKLFADKASSLAGSQRTGEVQDFTPTPVKGSGTTAQQQLGNLAADVTKALTPQQVVSELAGMSEAEQEAEYLRRFGKASR